MVKKTPGAGKPDMKSGAKFEPDKTSDIPHPKVEGHGDSSGNPDNKPRPKPL